MKKGVLTSIAIAGVVAVASWGYAAFAQMPDGVPDPSTLDCSTISDPDERSRCSGAQAGGVNPSAYVGTLTSPPRYFNTNRMEEEDDPSDPYADHIIWVQSCEVCSYNMVDEMTSQGAEGDALMGMAMMSKSTGNCGADPCPGPQCMALPPTECRDPDTCNDGCNDCPPGGEGDPPADCWEFDQLTNSGGCVLKPGCSAPTDPADPYPVVELPFQPEAWVWTGGCGDGSFGGFAQEKRNIAGNQDCGAMTDPDAQAACEEANPCTGLTDDELDLCLSAASTSGTGEDLYPSITGCWTPEERFVKAAGVHAEGGYIIVPDDARLTLHPRCVAGDSALQTNQPVFMADNPAGGAGVGDLATVETDAGDFGSFKPAHTLTCLHNDYIDDFSNFCRNYIMHDDRYLHDKWTWSTDTNCYTLEENIPAYAAPVAGEHYLPTALFYNEGGIFKAFPDGQSQNARYGNMGQHGFGRYRIYDPRMNPHGVYDPATGIVSGASVSLNPLDVYNYEATNGPGYAEALANDVNYVGRKFKLQACLRTYIEEYAHLGDCGGIVLPGAKNVSDSHCQWVIMARQEQNKTKLKSIFDDIPGVKPAVEAAMEMVLGAAKTMASAITGAEGGGVDIEFTNNKRGLRSEYFDYQNFATAGWVPSTPPLFGLPSDMSTDICTKSVTDGKLQSMRNHQVFNTTKGLDFARRGCPSVLGPDTWPDFFSMQSCDFERGAIQFAEGIRCLNGAVDFINGGCALDIDPTSLFYYQTFPPQVFPRNLSLSTNIKSPLAQLWWNGFRGGLISAGMGIDGWGSALSTAADLATSHIKPMIFQTVPPTGFGMLIQPPQDYIDPLWPARTCMHELWTDAMMPGANFETDPLVDFWYQTADWLPHIVNPLATKCMGREYVRDSCCGASCGFAGINCDCWPAGAGGWPEEDDPIEPNGDSCGAFGAYNMYDFGRWEGKSYRDGTCLDGYMPTETVFGFLFYAGDVPEDFRAYAWPTVMSIIGAAVDMVASSGLLDDIDMATLLGDMGFSPETIAFLSDVGEVIQDTRETIETINDTVDTVNNVVSIVSLASNALAMLDIIDLTPITNVADSVNGFVTKEVWDKFYAKVKPVLDIMQPNAILNAVGLGGFDMGCVVAEWDNQYGDGLEATEEYIDGKTNRNRAEAGLPTQDPNNPSQPDPNYPYEEGEGDNKTIPIKCLKTEAKENMPVIYSFQPNLMRFQDAHWCEFEVPYLPHVYDYQFSASDFIVIPGVYDEDNLSYMSAAYNAAMASLSPGSLSNFMTIRPDVDDVKNKREATDAYRFFSQLKAIYDPEWSGESLEDAPGFPMIERIRDGCGAFTQRASWAHDRDGTELSRWLTNNPQGRCAGWKGIYDRQYQELKIVSWRLPRFNYEFLKAFIECTGPVYSRGPNVCRDGIDWITVALNAMPCINWAGSCDQNWPALYYGTTGVQVMIPGTGRPVNMDDKTDYDTPWEVMGGGKKFGFWCSCPKDNVMTTVCNESFCTCDAVNFNEIPWVPYHLFLATSPDTGTLAPLSINMCEGYGPFAQWLQCYYNARSKACPVLTREISNGMPGSMHMLSDPNQMRTATGVFSAMARQPGEGVQAESICEGISPKTSYENIRWNAEEPNILAHLPITADYAARDTSPMFNEGKPDGVLHEIGFLKHRDLVFQSAVRDIEAPFLEITLPYPTSMDIPTQGVSLDQDKFLSPGIKTEELEIFEKAHDAANLAWLETRVSGLGGIDENGVFRKDWPLPRATEVIIGPRGCDIGGWYEMMLYQARCIRWFKLNCLCDYRKTFIQGSAEAYVLLRGGMAFPTRLARNDNGLLEVSQNKIRWPLMWRGFAGPNYAPPPRFVVNMETANGLNIVGANEWTLNDLVVQGRVIDTTQLNAVTSRAVARWEVTYAGKRWIDVNENLADRSPYKIRYEGLEAAEIGDFMIYDEEIPAATGPLAGQDAGYPRHVAYVEHVDKDKGIVTVSEMNWGKDYDSCGNTDRWGLVTTRRIFRDKEDINEEQLCNNPDWADCYEPNWYYIKIYRPAMDQSNPERPICFSTLDMQYPYAGEVIDGEYALHIPEPFGATGSRAMEVQFNDDGTVKRAPGCDPLQPLTEACVLPVPPAPLPGANPMAVEEVIKTGIWKYDYPGWYDASEVAAFVAQRSGRCDPPPIVLRCNPASSTVENCVETTLGAYTPNYSIPANIPVQ